MNVTRASPRIVFAGTSAFAVPSLEALLAHGYVPSAVYTQPDRPAGRGRRMRSSPVKMRALEADLPLRQPISLREETSQHELATLDPDLMIVVAYGLLLPAAVLAIPRLGCINVHASLLPRWRGAAPIQRALMVGDRETGISIMQMDSGLDTGPVLGQTACAIAPGTTGGELHDRLAVRGAETLVQLLPDIMLAKLTPQPQDETAATYAPKLDKTEANLDWSRPATELAHQVLAFNPWPVAHTRFDNQVLRIWRAEALPSGETSAPSGTVTRQTREGIDVATGQGRLRLTEIQLPGKRAMTAAEFVNAHSLTDRRLGPI